MRLLQDGALGGRIVSLTALSSSSVKFHLAALFRRLGVNSRTEAVAIALHKHLLKI